MDRYSRLVKVPEIGVSGIEALRGAHVGVIGCGALGSLCSMYLAASGVGTITIADSDVIDISNLQRQLFFSESTVGQSKSRILAERMACLNSLVKVNVVEQFITADNGVALLGDCDVVVDASDNPATKLLTDRISLELGIPCVIAGVRGFECQIMSCVPGSARYTDLFGDNLDEDNDLSAGMPGVVGPTAGIAASLEAAETIKIITGAGTPLLNRLLVFNLLNMQSHIIRL